LPDRTEMQMRRWRLIVVVLTVCIVLLIATELQLRLMGLQMYLPLSFLLFAVLGDLYCICFFFWLIKRARKKQKQLG